MTAIIAITKKGFTPYGAAETFWYSKLPEIILSGPYDTGKTITALNKMNYLLAKYPKARGLMTRKTYKSLINSAVVTFEEKVHHGQIGKPSYPVTSLGKSHPQWYDYPNGARLVLGGMDNPGKTLSSEYDFIYVNQAEELTADEWQALTRACTGRAGNTPFAQLMGDVNPDVPGHHLKHRERLIMHESRHEDNPDIYDQETGLITEQGKKRIAALDAMTGVRYKRGRLGLWVGREGQVYEFDPAIHLIDRFEIPEQWERYRVVDFGFTNPFVCQWWAKDHDGRLYMYREIYMSQRTVKVHSGDIKKHDDKISETVADHDAEDRATMAENGLHTNTADKRVSVGIEKVQERLKVQPDGKPRIFIMRDSIVEIDEEMKTNNRPYRTEDEFAGYVWPKKKEARAADEKPVKSDDHGMDAMRYMVMRFDGGSDINWSGFDDLGTIENYEPKWS